jgi:hypothetical protein
MQLDDDDAGGKLDSVLGCVSVYTLKISAMKTIMSKELKTFYRVQITRK